MKQIFFAVILLAFALIHFVILHNQRVRNRSVGIFSMVIFLLIAYFDVIPMIFYLANPASLTKGELMIYEADVMQFLLAEFSVAVFTFFLYFSYVKYNNRVSLDLYAFSEEKMLKALRFMGYTCFFVGSLTFAIYISGFGGLGSWYRLSNVIRSFAYSASSYMSRFASIMVIPAKLVVAAPILLYPLLKKNNTYPVGICFLTSFVLGALYNLGNAGKMDLIMYLMVFALVFFEKHFRHPWKLTIFCCIMAFPLINVLDGLFNYISFHEFRMEEQSVFDSLGQFAYPYKNILNMQGIVEMSGYRWGKDFVTGVLNVIPGISFEPSYVPVSEFFGGKNWKYVGGVPNDIITFGYQQLGIIGVAGMGVLFGIVCGKLDRVLKEIPKNSIFTIIKVGLIINIFSYVLNADITGLLMSRFALTTTAVCVLYSCHRIPKNKIANM